MTHPTKARRVAMYPQVPWTRPVLVSDPVAGEGLACRVCLASRKDNDEFVTLYETDVDVAVHLAEQHRDVLR